MCNDGLRATNVFLKVKKKINALLNTKKVDIDTNEINIQKTERHSLFYAFQKKVIYKKINRPRTTNCLLLEGNMWFRKYVFLIGALKFVE